MEANRCLFCYDAPCSAACPTHIDVPRFIKKIATDNLRGSAMTILDSNILGLSCSRVCPVEVLCEGACVMHRYNKEPIEIGRLQRHAMDYFYAHGAKLDGRGEPPGPRRMHWSGAGVAGLRGRTAAQRRICSHGVRSAPESRRTEHVRRRRVQVPRRGQREGGRSGAVARRRVSDRRARSGPTSHWKSWKRSSI